MRAAYLQLTCRLTEGHFHGIRLGADGYEECDWPPAPARAFQALVHATLAGVPASLRSEGRVPAVEVLRWLECLPCPTVEAATTDRAAGGTRFQLALPLTTRKGATLMEHSLQLAPQRRISGYDVAAAEAPLLTVRYFWPLPEGAAVPLGDLQEMAARVSYFGRAEDRAEFSFSLAEDLPPLAPAHRRWAAASSGTALAVPEPGSFAALDRRHESELPPRIRRPNTLSCFRSQPYRPHDTLEFPQPAAVGLVRIFDEADDALSFDPRDANKFRAQVRSAVCRAASDGSITWADDAFAQEIIAGHAPDGRATALPHLGIVPLPSLSRDGKSRGQVLRFALIGYAPPERAADAAEVYATLFRSLAYVPLVHDGQPTRCHLVPQPVRGDKVWALYSGVSAVWTTVLPAAFTSKFEVPRKASPHERHRRRLAELTRLTRRSLRLQGLAADVVEATDVVATASPLLRTTHRAEHYHAEGTTYRTHLRLSFPCELKGPVIVGDRRYAGFGLCFPG